jgi:hypothetical protein
MPSHLKYISLTVSAFCISYISYSIGAYRAVEVKNNLSSKSMIEFQISEARHDEGLVRALADNKNDISLQVAQHRYFTRMLLIAETINDPKWSEPLEYAKAQIAIAQELSEKLSYEFITEQENKRWEILTSQFASKPN